MSDRPASGTRLRDTWQRWEMANFDPPAPVVAPPPEPEPLPTAAQIRAELNRAAQLARESGRAQGFAEGHAQGLVEGRAQGHETGLAEGREKGFHEGLAEGRALAQKQAQQLQALADDCARSLGGLEQEIGQALISLATSIAEQVLRSTLESHPEKILDIVGEIVQMHGDSDAVLTLRVHPDDHALVHDHLEQDGALKRWRLLADDTLQAGGCRAETALGAIDATLQTRWRRALGTLGLTTGQSASLVVHDEVKRGSVDTAPKAPPHGGEDAPALRPERFTPPERQDTP